MDEHEAEQVEAAEIARIRAESGWTGLYFGGVAFKKQRPVDPAQHRRSAEIARPFMDVVTTSGIATGHEAGDGKIIDFRAGLEDAPLALASGITPENAARYGRDVDARYGRDVDCFLVATGINRDGDFYNIDPARLDALLKITRNMGAKP
jgi:predicted TIM-barrel enzyme